MSDGAICRGCGQELEGNPYHLGGHAYIPGTRNRAKVNFYGGWVCSEACDRRACLEMSSSMPHAGTALSLNSFELQKIKDNWGG